MTGSDVSGSASTETVPEAATVDLKLEVVTLPVSDIHRAKRLQEITTRLPGREWED